MLADDCFALIRREIVTCQLPPGGEVTEAELSERYGMGKAPVRAALMRLSAERLVQALPRRGYLVAPISVRNIEEVYQMRLLMEPAGAALVARLRADGKGRGVGDLIGETQHQDQPPTSLEEGMRVNRAFHLAIARAMGNARLEQTLERLLDDADRFIYMWISSGADVAGELLREESEHQAIAEAIIAGRPEAAERSMRVHLEEAHRAILGEIRSRPATLDLIISRAS
jgi:DNA-binding GntR family transcriptional regulator